MAELTPAERAELIRLRSKLSGEMSYDGTHPRQIEDDARGAAGAFIRTGLPQGLTLGAADEMQSYVTGENVDAIRARNAERERMYPDAVGAGKMTGAGMASVVPIGGAVNATARLPLLLRMGAGAGAGASIAATQGFLEGEGHVSDPNSTRIAGALDPGGLAIGAGGGAAVPAGGASIGRIVGALTRRKAPAMVNAGVDRQASQLASRAFRDDGAFLDDARAYLDSLGPEGMIADLGPNTRNQARALATIPGPGGQNMVRAVDERHAGQAGRINADVDQALGNPQNLVELQKTLKRNRMGRARRNYDFQGKDVNFDPFLKDALGRLEMMAPGIVKKNRNLARAEGVPLQREVIDDGVDYSLTPDELDSLEFEGEVRDFFNRYDELTQEVANFQKRPISAEIIRRGGIAPNGKVGQELRAMGLKPSDYPGLFRRGGLTDLDNIPLNEGPGVFAERYPGQNGYVPEQDWIDALAAEGKSGVRGRVDQGLLDELAKMEAELPQYEQWREEIGDGIQVLFPGDQKKDVISLSGLDYLTRNIGNSFEKGSNEARIATGIVKDIESRYPDLQRARREYASDSRVMDAAEEGAGLFKSNVSADEFRETWRGMSQEERAAFRLAARSELENKMAGSVHEGRVGQNALGTRATQEKIRIAFGDDAQAILSRRLDAEPVFSQTRSRVAHGSDTAASRAAQREIQPLVDETGQRRGPVGRVKQGAANLGNMAVDALIGRLPRNTAVDLSRVLSAQGPERDRIVQALMADMGQYAKADRNEALAAQIVQRLMAGGTGVALARP